MKRWRNFKDEDLLHKTNDADYNQNEHICSVQSMRKPPPHHLLHKFSRALTGVVSTDELFKSNELLKFWICLSRKRSHYNKNSIEFLRFAPSWDYIYKKPSTTNLPIQVNSFSSAPLHISQSRFCTNSRSRRRKVVEILVKFTPEPIHIKACPITKLISIRNR